MYLAFKVESATIARTNTQIAKIRYKTGYQNNNINNMNALTSQYLNCQHIKIYINIEYFEYNYGTAIYIYINMIRIQQ